MGAMGARRTFLVGGALRDETETETGCAVLFIDPRIFMASSAGFDDGILCKGSSRIQPSILYLCVRCEV